MGVTYKLPDSGLLRTTLYVGLCIFLGSVIGFSLFYLFSDYDSLVAWYFRLNPCFYRSNFWTTDFFTPAVKKAGNYYCMAAAIVALAGLVYCIIALKQKPQPRFSETASRFSPTVTDWLIISFLCTCGYYLWSVGNTASLPATDEAFSALEVAGIHPLQAVSYYMLPNNHVLFNLINHFLSSFSSDAVESGRFVSLVCYLLFIAVSYISCNQLTGNRILTALMTLSMSLQFYVWGFASQARGYELYLLCELGLAVSLFAYLSSGKRNWLYLNAFCIVAGYFCMPSFLYLHVATIVFLALYQLINGTRLFAPWTAQAIGIVATLICYLPALCFSGYNAIANNHYVAPMEKYKTASEFSNWMFRYLNGYTGHILFQWEWQGVQLHNYLLLLPLALLFSGRKSIFFTLGLFYITLCLTFLGLVIIMKRLPFERNLLGHYDAVVFFSLVSLFWLAGHIKKLSALLKVLPVSLAATALIFTFWFQNKTSIKYLLYEYDVNQRYSELCKLLSTIPANATAAYSPESFYCRYINKNGGVITSPCANGTEDYFVQSSLEAVDENLTKNYARIGSVGWYTIYKRR